MRVVVPFFFFLFAFFFFPLVSSSPDCCYRCLISFCLFGSSKVLGLFSVLSRVSQASPFHTVGLRSLFLGASFTEEAGRQY